jgi:hypothetical protein
LRTFYGPTPTIVFTDEGAQGVTLNVTDFRGLSDEVEVTITVIPRPLEHFTLFVGPVMDQYNLPVVGAQVEVHVGDHDYVGETMADGVAYLVLPGDAKGEEATVRIERKGIDTIDHSTSITSTGQMEDPIPTAHSRAEHKTPGASEGLGTMAWVLIVVVVLIAFLLAFLVVTRRIGGRKEDSLDEMEGEEGEPPDGAVEATTEEDLEAMLGGPPEEGTEEGEPEDEEVHVVTAPDEADEPDDKEGGPTEDGFRALPRSSTRRNAPRTLEHEEERTELTSAHADVETGEEEESGDTDI